MSKIGKNIRKIRATKGLSQTAFANLFNLTRASIGAYEEGRAEPKTDTTLQIAKYFSIPVEAFLAEELTVNRLTNFNLKSALSNTEISNTSPLLFVSQKNWNLFVTNELPVDEFTQETNTSFLTGEIAIEIHDKIRSPFSTGTIITCSKVESTSESSVYLLVSETKSIIGSASEINYTPSSTDKLFVIHQKIENLKNRNTSDLESRLSRVENQIQQILKNNKT